MDELLPGGFLLPFFVFELWSAIQFPAEDAVFGDEILVAEPKLLVDRACNESEQFLPRHELSPIDCEYWIKA